MKTTMKIAVIAMMGMSFGVNAQQQVTLEGANDPNFVNKNGNVGIGTTSPNATLDVNGSIKFDHLASGHTNIQIGHDVNDRIFADNSSNKYYGGGIFFRVTPDPSLNIPHN